LEAYCGFEQVQKRGELILGRAAEEKNKYNGKLTITQSKNNNNNAAKTNSINQSMKRSQKNNKIFSFRKFFFLKQKNFFLVLLGS